jgi:hypothetical protein
MEMKHYMAMDMETSLSDIYLLLKSERTDQNEDADHSRMLSATGLLSYVSMN